jgi:hypothetical protein
MSDPVLAILMDHDCESSDVARRKIGVVFRDLIDPADIIGPGEIRVLAGGVTRATMKNWREGRNVRGAGAFPAPFKTVSGVELYDRRTVCAWLEQHRP